jgi:hypothetical protein
MRKKMHYVAINVAFSDVVVFSIRKPSVIH